MDACKKLDNIAFYAGCKFHGAARVISCGNSVEIVASERPSERNETSRTWRSDSRRMKKDPRGGRGNENARQGESNRSANGETLFMEKGYLNFKRITKHIFLNYAKTYAANIYYIERKLKFKKYLLYKLRDICVISALQTYDFQTFISEQKMLSDLCTLFSYFFALDSVFKILTFPPEALRISYKATRELRCVLQFNIRFTKS